MSAWKNVGPRREHRERSQPSRRRRHGLLEKHSDYVKRARNFHSKEDRLLSLRRKAALRNPDEFYQAMTRARTEKGLHRVDRAGGKYSAEEMMLLKTQDASYLSLKATAERRKIEKLQPLVAARPGDRKHAPTHLVWEEEEGEGGEGGDGVVRVGRKRGRGVVGDGEEGGEEEEEWRGVEEDEKEAMLEIARERGLSGWKEEHFRVLRGKKGTEDGGGEKKSKEKSKERAAREKLLLRAREKTRKELIARKQRLQALERTAAKLETEKAMRSKGRKKITKDPVTGEVSFRFKRQRKK